MKCKLDPTLPKGTAGWELTSSGIPGRSSQQCRQRWDTVQKSYKKIKGYCVAHGKEFSEVLKEEFVSMKLEMTFFTNVHWYKMIDDYSSRPARTSFGPAANELNGGYRASTSAHPVGKPDLAAFSVEQIAHLKSRYVFHMDLFNGRGFTFHFPSVFWKLSSVHCLFSNRS